MKNDLQKNEDAAAAEPVVIPDECGDSMWDLVLEQSPFVQELKKAADKINGVATNVKPSTN